MQRERRRMFIHLMHMECKEEESTERQFLKSIPKKSHPILVSSWGVRACFFCLKNSTRSSH